MSYLIIDNKCAATTTEELKCGEAVLVSTERCGNRLIGEEMAIASNDKKWRKEAFDVWRHAVLIDCSCVYDRYHLR